VTEYAFVALLDAAFRCPTGAKSSKIMAPNQQTSAFIRAYLSKHLKEGWVVSTQETAARWRVGKIDAFLHQHQLLYAMAVPIRESPTNSREEANRISACISRGLSTIQRQSRCSSRSITRYEIFGRRNDWVVTKPTHLRYKPTWFRLTSGM
jgi:hypothetical protein